MSNGDEFPVFFPFVIIILFLIFLFGAVPDRVFKFIRNSELLIFTAYKINLGSPFICHLVMAQSVTVSGPGLERIPVGQVTQIYVAVEGMKDMLPQIRITDSQGNNIPVSISKSDTEDKKYIISYTPKNVGNHQVSSYAIYKIYASFRKI